MTPRFSGSEITTNELRAQLISLSESGDKDAPNLLREIAKRPEETAGELVGYYLQRVGSSSLETTLAGLALLCFGLVFGIVALTMGGLVAADLESLFILTGAFLGGYGSLTTYNTISSSRHYAREFQKMAGIHKMSSLIRQQYRTNVASMSYAYSL